MILKLLKKRVILKIFYFRDEWQLGKLGNALGSWLCGG